MGPLLRWFVFSVGFGLLPFAFSVLLRLLHGEPPELVQNAPELLFFTLMVCAIQMGETVGGAPPASAGASGRSGRDAAFCGFLLVAVFAAVVYGVYVQAARGIAFSRGAAVCPFPAGAPADACAGWVTFQSNVFSLSVTLAVAAGIAGTIAEAIRPRRSR